MAETERTVNHMTERGADWPERYPGALAAEMHVMSCRARHAEAQRWVGLLDDECLRAHDELDRLRLHPERPDRDANLLDNFEEGLARAVEAHDEAVARREQLRTGLHEAQRVHQLGLPSFANPCDAEGGESS